MADYKHRIADAILKHKILGKGAVLIEGPKWCGKTTTARQLAKSFLDLGDSAVLKQSIGLIEISPKTLLEGSTPRLIDEWQALPPIWDSIRSEVDRRGAQKDSSCAQDVSFNAASCADDCHLLTGLHSSIA